jgi:hypothetical protein
MVDFKLITSRLQTAADFARGVGELIRAIREFQGQRTFRTLPMVDLDLISLR